MLLDSPMPAADAALRDAALEARAEADMRVIGDARRIANEGAVPEVTVRPDTLFVALLPRSAVVSVDPGAASASAVAQADRAQLEAQLADARGELERALGKLANERFISGAPDQVVAAEREKAERYGAEVAELERRLGEA
jgi:valyl-tRNA synthetase